MTDLEYEIIERAKLYQTKPEELWEWLFHPQEGDRYLRECFERIAINVRDQLYPITKRNKENLVDLYPVQVLWGHQSRLGSGIGTDRLYNYYYGTFGTGYMLLTDRNCHISVSSDLTKKCPLRKEPGIISFVLMGMLGERDKTKPTLEDRYWRIPAQSIKAAKVTTDMQRQECVELVTNESDFLVYPVHEIMLTALQMIISGRMTEIFGTQQSSQTSHTKDVDSLHALQQINFMLEEEEYEIEKPEIRIQSSMKGINANGCFWSFLITAGLAGLLSLPTLGVVWLVGGMIATALGSENGVGFGLLFILGLFVGVWVVIYLLGLFVGVW